MKEVLIDSVLKTINSVDAISITIEDLDHSLYDLGMDSISFIRLVIALEEEFDCEIPDTKLMITEMDTARKIIDILQTLYDEQNIINK